MMRRECLTCGKESDDKKQFFELSAKVGPRYLCRECAAELGIKNFMSAGFNSNTSILKKYVKIHPEAQDRLDKQMQRVKEYNDTLKKEASLIIGNATKHAGCVKKKQTKCSCNSCGNVFYFATDDVIKNVANVFHGSLYSLNQVKDLEQCPKCGSRAVSKRDVFFWIDKKGNCVDVEE